MPPATYTKNELRVLWCLKRHGGRIVRNVKRDPATVFGVIAEDTRLSVSSVRFALRQLETKCLVVRNYVRPPEGFAAGGGRNDLLSVEMVDPKMALPHVEPVPLAVVVARENDELGERVAVDPDRDVVIEALLDRVLELQRQVDKLLVMVERLNDENESLRKRSDRRTPPEHLTARIQDALTPEKWEQLRGK